MSVSPYPHNAYLYRILTRERLFSAEECERILELTQQAPTESSLIKHKREKDETIRNSNTSILKFSEHNKWVYEKLMSAIQEYNKVLKFRIGSLEPLQVQAYRPGGFYSWHMDLGDGNMSTRKISVVVLLNNVKQFKGGKLEFWTGSNRGQNLEVQQGDAVMFPPYLLHRVTPVTEGLRHTMVGWVHGPSFS